MSGPAWRTQLIVPPSVPHGRLRGLAVMARNPARWWPASMYDEGVRRVRLPGRTFVHVARPELARAVLLDEADAFGRSFVTQRILGPAMGGGLLTSDGERWRRQRRLAAPVFRATALERFVPAMDRHALACRDALLELDGRTAAVLPHAARATLDIIVETMFGDVGLDREAVTADVDAYLARLGRPDPLALLGVPDAVPRPGRRAGLAAVARLRGACRDALAAMRASGGTDAGGLAGRLLAATDPDTGERLDDETIVDNVVTFVGAGHETTAVALAWTLYALAHLPGLADRLAEESRNVLGDAPVTARSVASLELHRRTVREAMRLYPPVATIVRTVRRPVRVGPFALEAGDHVHDRDDAHAPEPRLVARPARVRRVALRVRCDRGARPVRVPAVRRRAADVHRRGLRAERGGARARAADPGAALRAAGRTAAGARARRDAAAVGRDAAAGVARGPDGRDRGLAEGRNVRSVPPARTPVGHVAGFRTPRAAFERRHPTRDPATRPTAPSGSPGSGSPDTAPTPPSPRGETLQAVIAHRQSDIDVGSMS